MEQLAPPSSCFGTGTQIQRSCKSQWSAQFAPDGGEFNGSAISTNKSRTREARQNAEQAVGSQNELTCKDTTVAVKLRNKSVVKSLLWNKCSETWSTQKCSETPWPLLLPSAPHWVEVNEQTPQVVPPLLTKGSAKSWAIRNLPRTLLPRDPPVLPALRKVLWCARSAHGTYRWACNCSTSCIEENAVRRPKKRCTDTADFLCLWSGAAGDGWPITCWICTEFPVHHVDEGSHQPGLKITCVTKYPGLSGWRRGEGADAQIEAQWLSSSERESYPLGHKRIHTMRLKTQRPVPVENNQRSLNAGFWSARSRWGCWRYTRFGLRLGLDFATTAAFGAAFGSAGLSTGGFFGSAGLNTEVLDPERETSLVPAVAAALTGTGTISSSGQSRWCWGIVSRPARDDGAEGRDESRLARGAAVWGPESLRSVALSASCCRRARWSFLPVAPSARCSCQRSGWLLLSVAPSARCSCQRPGWLLPLTSRIPWAPALHPWWSICWRSIRIVQKCSHSRSRLRSWIGITCGPVSHVSLLRDPNPPPLTFSTRCRWLRWSRRCSAKIFDTSEVDCRCQTTVVPAALTGTPRIAPSPSTMSRSRSRTFWSPAISHAVAPMAAKDRRIVVQAQVMIEGADERTIQWPTQLKSMLACRCLQSFNSSQMISKLQIRAGLRLISTK